MWRTSRELSAPVGSRCPVGLGLRNRPVAIPAEPEVRQECLASFAAGWPVRPQACHQAVVTIKAPSLSGQDGIPTGDPGMRVALYRGQAASVIRQCAATGGPHARR